MDDECDRQTEGQTKPALATVLQPALKQPDISFSRHIKTFQLNYKCNHRKKHVRKCNRENMIRLVGSRAMQSKLQKSKNDTALDRW